MREEVQTRPPPVPARARALQRPRGNSPEREGHGLQQADDQVAGGRRRGAGARAPDAATRRSIPSTSCSRCSTRSCRARSSSGRTSGLRAPRRGGGDASPRSRRSRGGAAAARLGRVLARCSTARSRRRARSRTSTSPSEHLLLALDVVPRDELLDAAQGGARLAAGDVAGSRGHLPGAREVRARPDRARRGGQARPGHRPRRGDPPRDPGALAPDEEQPGADRRSRRRQDGDRRGARAAHRRGRRPRGAQGQARLGARHRRAARRLEVPRRVRGAAQGRPRRDQGVRAARSSSSSTSCTRSSARARPRARSTRPTC